MYKIAHITDVHIKYDKLDPNYVNFKKLLNSVKANECDHILLTGDISDYADARDHDIIRRMLEDYNILDGNKLSVVPGNHDIYGGPGPDLSSALYPAACRELDYMSKVYSFHNAFRETFDNAFIDSENIFPYYKILDDKFAVIGINSIAKWSIDKNGLGTNGYVNDKDIKKLKTILKIPEVKDKFKIVMIHHQFNLPDLNHEEPEHALWLTVEHRKMKMYGKKRLEELFMENDIYLVLHGHTHITDNYSKNGCLYVNSSGCSIPFTRRMAREYYIISFTDDVPITKFNIEKTSI